MARHALPDDDTTDDPGGLVGSVLFTAAFWIGAGDRALRSAFQAVLLLYGADQGLNLFDIDLLALLGLGGGMALLSIATSVVTLPFGERGAIAVLPGGS